MSDASSSGDRPGDGDEPRADDPTVEQPVEEPTAEQPADAGDPAVPPSTDPVGEAHPEPGADDTEPTAVLAGAGVAAGAAPHPDASPTTDTATDPATDTPDGGGSGRGRRVGLVVGGVVLLGLVGGGAFAWSQLGGGGTQPHDVLPADSVAYARIDLDPDAGQKVDLFRLARRVPDLAEAIGIDGDDDDPRRLIAETFVGACDLDYDDDLEPWLGERIGLSFGPDGEDDLRLAVQVTDEDAARDGIDALFACGDEEHGIAFLDGYAIVTPSQASADDAVEAAQEESLADDEDFQEAQDQLDEQGIASVWFDYESFAETLAGTGFAPQDVAELERATEGLDSGLAMSLSATSTTLELHGVVRVDDEHYYSDLPEARSLDTLPGDTVLGLVGVGGDDLITDNWDALKTSLQDALDLAGLFGVGGGFTAGSDLLEDDSFVADEPITPGADATNVLATVESPEPVPTPTWDQDAYLADPEGYPQEYSRQLQEAYGLDPDADPFGEDPLGGADGEDPFDDPFGEDPFSEDPFADDPFADELAGGTPPDVDEVIADVEELLDVELPADLATLLGDGFTLYVGGDGLGELFESEDVPDPSAFPVGARLEGDADASTDLVERLARSAQSLLGADLVSAQEGNLVSLATSQDVADALVEEGDLGGSDAYRSVMEGAEAPAYAFFADVGTVLDLVAEVDPSAEGDPVFDGLRILDAVGIWSTRPDDDGWTRSGLTVSFTED